MYCPRCASPTTPGQRFCRACGTDLGLILDAIEGKRGPIDFESLKADLRKLGSNLRVGFEEAREGFQQGIKRTQRLKPTDPSAPAPLEPVAVRVKRVRGGSTRQYSLQRAMLSIFSGGAIAGTLNYLLNIAANSGLLANIEREVLQNLQLTIYGFAPVLRGVWVVGLIPMVKGVAHLINGICFPARPEPDIKEVVITVPTQVRFSAVSTPSAIPIDPTIDELESDARQPISVTEDETLRLGAQQAKSQP
jgi:hypothetical protein